MLTIYAVPADALVLVGRLAIHRSGRIKGRPYLAVDAFCPWCKESHRLEWVDHPFDLSCVLPVAMPCRRGPLAGREALIGLDPSRRADHRKSIADFAASLRRWRSQERLARDFADSRASDRLHLGEGWDVTP